MKNTYGLLALATLVFSQLIYAATNQAETAAETSAVAWLKLVDSADYAGSWDAAASTFKQSISKPQWGSAAAGARAPLGKLLSRTLQTARYTKSLPGAPEGEYVVITFAAVFENKAAAVETITPTRDADGAWRVSGYYIR
ncbi:MAG: DUF4019 domain-containing protein [Gammaproteobacteria bacterium]